MPKEIGNGLHSTQREGSLRRLIRPVNRRVRTSMRTIILSTSATRAVIYPSVAVAGSRGARAGDGGALTSMDPAGLM